MGAYVIMKKRINPKATELPSPHEIMVGKTIKIENRVQELNEASKRYTYYAVMVKTGVVHV